MRIFQTLGAPTAHSNGFDLSLDEGWTLRVRAMSETLLRIVVAPPEGLALDRTWMIAPEGDTPAEGRSRESLAGFSPVAADLTTSNGDHILTAGRFRVTLRGNPVRMDVEQRVGDDWKPWLRDRATGGLALCDGDRRIRHFQMRLDNDRHFGLGDKTGPLDRTGRRFRLLQLDALGYDAEIGDPLYKHTPYMAVQSGDVCGGLFYDTLAPMTFDLGCERSNYHGIYRYVEAEERGLDLWLVAGPDLAATTRRFTMLTGRPAFPPRWSYGFAFTTMHHADDAEAQQVIAAFAERCRKEEIAISAIHFGSGYSSRGKRRYVFTWNRQKFPDPSALFAKLKALGFYTVANLKPVLIDDHPDYASVKAAGGFVKARDGAPVLEQFWDGMGSYLDFTNEQTAHWWQQRLVEQVLDIGFDAGWNDNNEYEIGQEDAIATGHGRPFPATAARPLHALLMTRATFEASRARAPASRPYTITRAGPVGLHRYAETWTGDNATSWHTLKWNLRNGLSMALSGQSNVGHDIGGFTGPRPDGELLCRFIEMMALHPRAVMNSWKPHVAPDWTAATVPWLYPEVLPQIRAALDLRTRFLPLIYTLAQRYHAKGEPMIRPLFHDFANDPDAYRDQDAMMLGPDVLFSPVVEPGARVKTQYLPLGPSGWVDFHSGQVHAAGQNVTVAADLGCPAVFVRVGAALVLASALPHVRPHDAPARQLYLSLAPGSGEGGGIHFEDDGTSWDFQAGNALVLSIRLTWTADEARVRLTPSAGSAWNAGVASNWSVAGSGLKGRHISIEPA
ncbi:MAG TPA: glycoside hydrolase family 31 protein [Beijerinckiaceae bacterium]|nr:glycoside hydrolase family 31 protein [Beijerinckiaceae bacterium]